MAVYMKLVMIMGVRVVKFATSKNLIVTSTMFPHRNIHKFTLTFPVKTHNQIDQVVVDRRWHLSVLDVQSFRGAHCDTDHYLGTVRENISISGKETLGCYEFKKHKPWFNEGCLRLLDGRKQAKLQ
jgi:hypothetical protein